MALPKDLEEYRSWLDAEIRRLGTLQETVITQLEQLRLARFHLPEPEPVVSEKKPPRSRTRPKPEKRANLCGKDGPEYYGPCVLPKGHEEPHTFELWRRTPGKQFACWELTLDEGGYPHRCVAEKGHGGDHTWKPETIQKGDSTVSTPENGGPG